jgi:superfamily I DNA and/or RNA helicase
MHIPNTIQYFHDCYRADNRELVIFDFLDRKVENKVFIEGEEELLNNQSPIKAIEAIKAENILKKLEVFQKEKELLYGSFFVCGHYVNFKGVTKRLCAPLFYYPAEIEYKEDFYYVSIKSNEQRINYPLINLLMKDTDGDIFHDSLFQNFTKDFIKFGDMSHLMKISKKYFPSMNTDYVLGYPQNISIKTVRNKIKELGENNSDNLVLLPTSILGIVAKSTQTRGVLNELSELVQVDDFSTPLKSLFSNAIELPQKKSYSRGELPMILSDAQNAILESGAVNPLTLIIGPPGTGKTYTIGALAIEHMSRGESVLIASRTDEAVDVIAEKIKSQIGIDKCVVRGGRKRIYSTPLNRFLKSLLTRVRKLRYLLQEFDVYEKFTEYDLAKTIFDIDSSIQNRREWIEDLENTFYREIENELKWGTHLSIEDKNFWNNLKTQYLKFKNKIQVPIWEHSQKLHHYDQVQLDKVQRLIRMKYISQILEVLRENWGDLKEFYEALKLASDTDRLSRFNKIDFQVVLKAFPIWLTNLSEVKDVLPFEKEMFDVVIIDEATQCDIASCLPLIQRAKRVVIAGDPNQLRHVSFLSRGMQNMLREKYELQTVDREKLNYRDRSILDLVLGALNRGEQVAMLDEHFRSHASIISFSNKKFYGEELKIMTSRPDEIDSKIVFFHCDGNRTKDGSNQIEVQKLLGEVRLLIDTEFEINDDLCASIGILSPFRGQVDALTEKMLTDFLVGEIEKHRIRVGTAYSFQGEERDIMFLSFAVDSSSHHSAFSHINKEDVFNVSITRARNKQFIFLSFTNKDLKGKSLIRDYLSENEKQVKHRYSENVVHDQFLEEVKSKLLVWDIKLHWVGFSIAGTTVDLLLKYNGQYIAIDLIGYPGEFLHSFGIERYRILNRAGVKVLPLTYSDWYFDNEDTSKVLRDFIHKESPINKATVSLN